MFIVPARQGSQLKAEEAPVARMPAYKLREQEPSVLVEMARRVANETEEYLLSTEARSLTNLRAASLLPDEPIGTPVRVKKKSKSPTRTDRQKVTVILH